MSLLPCSRKISPPPVQSEALQKKRHGMVGAADLWEMKRAFQISFLTNNRLEPHHRLLDLGCGTLRGGLPLIQYLDDGNYVGVDIRKSVIDEAGKELREAGLAGKHPTLLLCADLSKLNIDGEFHFIWAFSVLFHLSDEVLKAAFGFVARHLAAEGVFFANVITGQQPKNHDWQGFPVLARELSTYSLLCVEHGLALSDLGSLAEHGHDSNNRLGDRQRILAFTRN